MIQIIMFFLCPTRKWYKLQWFFVPDSKMIQITIVFLCPTRKWHKLQWFSCARLENDTNYNGLFEFRGWGSFCLGVIYSIIIVMADQHPGVGGGCQHVGAGSQTRRNRGQDNEGGWVGEMSHWLTDWLTDWLKARWRMNIGHGVRRVRARTAGKDIKTPAR